jgi:hypothetical protein
VQSLMKVAHDKKHRDVEFEAGTWGLAALEPPRCLVCSARRPIEAES